MYDIVIANRIQELLDEREWSLYQLAKNSDVSYSTLYTIPERNTEPSIRTLSKICDGFGITIGEFFKENTSEDVNNRKEMQLLCMYRSFDKTDRQRLLAYAKGLSERK